MFDSAAGASLPPPPLSVYDSGLDLAVKHAPIIMLDKAEPFEPLVAGYTIFRGDGPSPSHSRAVTMIGGARQSVEYAIWWDWDIGHLYELEHVWVYLDAGGRVVGVEGSAHGQVRNMSKGGRLEVEDGHPVLYAEPGKHAFAPDPSWYEEVRSRQAPRSLTRHLAGMEGVLAPSMFAGRIAHTPLADTLARTYLQSHAFDPAWSFERRAVLGRSALVPWQSLMAWIPVRVNAWIELLERQTPPSAYRYLRIGHRGAAAHAPHNTLAGMRRAVELGADAVELDVRSTADEEIVLAHDEYWRTPGGYLPIQENTLEALREVDLGGGERVPMLDEALALARDLGLGLYLEIKDGRAVHALAEAIVAQDMKPWVIVGSFRPDWIAHIGAEVPGLRTSVLFGAANLDPVALARSVGAEYVHPCWERLGERPSRLLTPEWMRAVRGAGLGVICWHEERPEVIADLRELGVDGICSDRPEMLV